MSDLAKTIIAKLNAGVDPSAIKITKDGKIILSDLVTEASYTDHKLSLESKLKTAKSVIKKKKAKKQKKKTDTVSEDDIDNDNNQSYLDENENEQIEDTYFDENDVDESDDTSIKETDTETRENSTDSAGDNRKSVEEIKQPNGDLSSTENRSGNGETSSPPSNLTKEAEENAASIGLGTIPLDAAAKEEANATIQAMEDDPSILEPNSEEREIAAATIEDDGPRTIRDNLSEKQIREIIEEYMASREQPQGMSTGSKVALLMGGLVVAGILGVALFSVSPVLALYFAGQISEHVGTVASNITAEYKENQDNLLENGETVIAALYLMQLEAAQEDTLKEICLTVSDYVRNGILTEQDLLKLKEFVS
jgi:hypothetical protein